MSQTYAFKRGATLSLAGTVTLPAPTGAWTATAQVRSDDDSLVEDLAVTVSESGTPGTYNVLVVGDSVQTADWPVDEKLRCDVRFADGATPPIVIPSPTFYIKTVAGVTSAGT